MEKVYYRSESKSVCADVIPFFEDGEFKLFYLKDFRDIKNKGEGCPWCLLTTKDLIHYVDNGPTLLRGTKDEQDLYVFTGSIIKKDNNYIIYYTGHNPHLRAKGYPEQKILRAFSKDLKTWKKDKNFVFESTDKFEIHDWRDPFVYFDEDNNIYRMLFAARLKNNNPFFTKGVTLMATSKDCDHWEVEDIPFYYPHSYFTHECPDLFKMGDWWYLIFSEFTDKISTTYRMSKSPMGPWTTPLNNTFDGHAFYAAKSTLDDKGRRILFGWNPIKDEEKDYNFWQWGGTIIPHEIIQNDDGTLSVRCPIEIKEAFKIPYNINEIFKLGDIFKIKNGYSLGSEGTNIVMFNEIPNTCQISMKFKTYDERGTLGVILKGQDNLDRFYKVKFEPRFNRLSMDMIPRRDNTVHMQCDVERYIKLNPNEDNTLLIIMQDSVLEVYVNDKVAMSGRMFDIKDGNFGIFTDYAKADFYNIEVKTLND